MKHCTGIRLWVYNLIFFVSLAALSCNQPPRETELVWSEEMAVAVRISKDVVKADPGEIEVHLLMDSVSTGMLGHFVEEGDHWRFEPVIPFTRGLRYVVSVGGEKRLEFEVPMSNKELASVLHIYPSQDTVPENLLKFYIQFSAPMREGMSANSITLLDGKSDTVQQAFLNLQPELWNEDRTLLTLWLDPGRIKRELSPNVEKGAPLVEGRSYMLVVSSHWKDAMGRALREDYRRSFYVTKRDERSPVPGDWRIAVPVRESRSKLEIFLGESLDYSLLLSSLSVLDDQEMRVEGHWRVRNEEQVVSFTPDRPWKSGNYTLLAESRLEDLAANNLDRLFDVDLLEQKPVEQGSVRRTFTIDR